MNYSVPNGSACGRVWFESGQWWFHRPGAESPCDLTRIMRETLYRIDPICGHLGVGRRTFERAVSKSLGIAPGRWLREQRAIAARHHLREGVAVKQLAADLGFADASRFSDEFKRWYRVSPSAFQRMERARMGKNAL